MSTEIRYLAAALALAVSSPAAPPTPPALAHTANFEVYAQGGADDARVILLEFERLREYFSRHTGLRLDHHSPVRVIAFRSPQDYAPYQLRPATDAYYVGSDSRDTIVMTAPAAGDIRVAAHEYAHFVWRAQGLALPPWLNEGLSESLATVRLDARDTSSASALSARSRALRTRPWIPLAQLVTLPEDSALREQRDTIDIFYAESWALADLLTASPDYRGRFPALVAALSSGAPSDRALPATYGKSLNGIAADLSAWVHQRRVTPVALPLADGGLAIEVSELAPRDWSGLLAELLLATSRLDRAQAAYRELARDAPQDPAFPAALAAIALRLRDFAAAREYWRRASDLQLRDAAACYRYAALADAAGLPAADIRPALERAVALQPDFDDAHFHLAHLDSNAGQYESAVAHLRAMRSVSPARRFAYWAALSYALNELGRHQEAAAAALRARDYAASAAEHRRALELAQIAATDVAVRFTRDAAGNSRLVTTRVPRDEPWNPFIEPGDQIRRVSGRLRAIDCGAVTHIVVASPLGSITLSIPDPQRVQMRNAPPEFTCGPQPDPSVTVVYAAPEPGETGTFGVVRAIEFN